MNAHCHKNMESLEAAVTIMTTFSETSETKVNIVEMEVIILSFHRRYFQRSNSIILFDR